MNGKKVIVTGSTKGIGKAIVDLLASKGYHIACCARTKEDIHSQIQDLSTLYPDQRFYGSAVDVSKKDELVQFANQVHEFFGLADALVNNAGVFIQANILEEADEVLEMQLKTNLMSAYTLSREIAPAMAERGSGDIVNMCSIAGIQPYPNAGSYCISKFAMRGLSMVLREELKEKGVRVTTILPGGTWSDSWAGVELPEDRLMPASDIASTVLMAIELDGASVLEEIILRPQLGDL